MSPTELPKAYQPGGIEESWYEKWDRAGHFGVDANDPRPPFTIVIPPPNVTGSLHMGHALDNTLQDILIRYKRMNGFATLWLPGTDHAGIATQNVVERELVKEKTSRQELGREKFIERVWKWKEESGGKIVTQLRRLGASCDWSRERFTMDPGLSKAVRTVFVSLYREGLIYRSSYLISWCPRCHTALSDLEVEHKDIDGQLTYFHYETTDRQKISVATTRPETMLGDTAVAVHPDDPRYKGLIGKSIRHPFVPREFPIIGDAEVKREFGTGAVKVTPAHDPVDYEMGKRHNLAFITVLTEEAKMTADTGAYQGLDRFEARKRVVAQLKAQGLFEKVEPHKHAVGHCQRCGTVVEPRVSEQWFVKIAPLAAPAIAAVKDGRTVFVPESWTKTYLGWMENIRDWCISRQLWWGHQIPVWYCDDCGKQTVPLEDPTHCEHCKSEKIHRDPDVLDTWFSSSLWPFSTLGWPEPTADLKKFYPTTVLVTGFDIIFFWVARMMMMGMKFMKEPPFGTVHIHALVRDEKGQKMSKSKGNVVDPLELMDRYGTDSFRFALTAFAAQGRDISLSEKRIEGYRNFINKLWNSARFALGTVGDTVLTSEVSEPRSTADQWIRHSLNDVIGKVREGIETMCFNEAAEAVYDFTWHQFCDWYLEAIKIHFAEGADPAKAESSRQTLLYILDRILRLLHPICPFVTEEIWQKLPVPRTTTSIMLAPFPKDDGYRSPQSVSDFESVMGVVDTIRNIRSENRIAPSMKVAVQIRLGEESSRGLLTAAKNQSAYIESMARLSKIEFEPKTLSKTNALGLWKKLEVHVPLEGLIDTRAELDRLEKERTKAAEDFAFLGKRLSDPSYRQKAPPQLIAKDEAKLEDARKRLEKIVESISLLKP